LLPLTFRLESFIRAQLRVHILSRDRTILGFQAFRHEPIAEQTRFLARG
jgi:hypothetical protein